MGHQNPTGPEGQASKSRKVPFRPLTPEERRTAPTECHGCGRDAIVWVCCESGGLLGYCGYLDSGACLALVTHEAAAA